MMRRFGCGIRLTVNLNGRFPGHANAVHSVAFSQDGKTLASGSSDQTIRLWDVDTGEHKDTFLGHTSRVNAVAFSPDDKTLASGSSDMRIRLWDPKTGLSKPTLAGHPQGVNALAFSPDGPHIRERRC